MVGMGVQGRAHPALANRPRSTKSLSEILPDATPRRPLLSTMLIARMVYERVGSVKNNLENREQKTEGSCWFLGEGWGFGEGRRPSALPTSPGSPISQHEPKEVSGFELVLASIGDTIPSAQPLTPAPIVL